MRIALIAVAFLALVTPAAALTQEVKTAPAAVAPAPDGSQQFVIFFDRNDARLTAHGRRAVAEAAEAYRRTEAARVSLVGHADRAGDEYHNQLLAERRLMAVARALIHHGVPVSAMATMVNGETDPALPTADGVSEPRNRRVEIVVGRSAVTAAAPEAVPVADTPTGAVEAMPSPSAPIGDAPPVWGLALGGIYGHNGRETDQPTESDLAGIEASLILPASRNVSVSIDQAALRSGNAVQEGWAGRSAIGLNLRADLGRLQPYLGANIGAVYGAGVQDGLIAGPEAGLSFDVTEQVFLYARASYDHQFRNPPDDADDDNRGIVTGGFGAGYRF